jgi:MoaA/NifB/PqqE/SkfB family radical SAM enzyme
MANQKIFCNTPWYEAHIYWDGSLGICCQESQKLYTVEKSQKFNIKNMSLTEWVNTYPVKQMRLDLLSNQETKVCSRCYHEESLGGYSRRHRSNQKSVIFTRTAFETSFSQSPGYPHFQLSQTQEGITDTLPIELHIDLGNYCNLACKMCWSQASSTIAVQNVKWGLEEHKQYLGNDWTKDSTVWNKFLNELLTIPKLKNLHFMGGETLLTKRFEELVDFCISHKKFDLCFSFVTNGTTFNQSLLDKLKLFTRVGIEVSIETITKHNDYVRQGTNTEEVLKNISKYIEYCNGSSISLTIRPAVSFLTVGYYYTLLKYCLDNKLLIKSLLVVEPTFLDVKMIPLAIRKEYVKNYQSLLIAVDQINIQGDYNESDPNNYANSIKIQILLIINVLNQPEENNSEEMLRDMVEHCRKWDEVYKFNAVELYPEFKHIFDRYGY